MKKLVSVLLAIVLILLAGMFTASAEGLDKDKLMLTTSKMSLAVLAAMPDTVVRKNTQLTSGDFVLSGQDIPVEDGKYSYLLRVSPNGTLEFDNQLERKYQGIDDQYQLHYEIDEANRHTMIVTGDFDHIITGSPLLEMISAEIKRRILSNVSEDSYFYQLTLKTEKEFTFKNSLGFLYDSDRHGFSIDYRYDIPAGKQTVKFNVMDATKQAIRTALTDAADHLKKLLPGN